MASEPSAGPEGAAPGCAVELVGSFQGSGRTDDTYVAKRDDGQWVQLSPLLWLTLSNLDGVASATEVAERVSAAWGSPVAGADIDYLIEHKLVPAGLVGTAVGTLERPDLFLSLRAKKVVVPGAVVSALSRPLRFLFFWPIVAYVSALFLGIETYAFASGRLLAGIHQAIARPSSLLLVVALIVCSIPVHEMGHASGCRYGGATPGAMGVGIYIATPAAYTDLSDGYRLGRAGRVRGDLGGVYFNALYAVAVFCFYLLTGSALLLLVIGAMVFEMLEQMMPFVRSDGYWAISDLVGVPDLFTYVGAAFRRGKAGSPLSRLTPTSRRVVRAWSLLTLIVLPIAVLFLLLALPALVVASWNSVETHVRALPHLEGAAAVATAVLGIAFTCIFMFAMAYGVVYITKRLVRAASNSAAARPHATQRAERINRRARASLVLCAIAVPVVWSATHVRIH